MQNEKIKFRKAVSEDADGVAEVLLRSYNMKDHAEARQAFLVELQMKKHFVVAEEEGKIVGVVSWCVHDLPKHQLAELHRIAVLPEHRGKGIAKQLFNALLEDCGAFYKEKGTRLRKLFLLTHASNKTAHAVYEKLGFKPEARLPNHYYDGEDEIVYSMFF
jgi:ribosomal protein S18 acetylase RimI-like enzyme